MTKHLTEVYSREDGRRIRCAGYKWSEPDSCRTYFASRVSRRLRDSSGAEFLRQYVQRMPETGFSLTHLERETIREKSPRDWEVGEAFAEAILEDSFDCLFPWPTGWDHRETEGHLTGPDLPGYHLEPERPPRFAFGEVKSSSHRAVPPAVVLGIDGKAGNSTMTGQLRRLLTEPNRRQTLIAWLGFRESNGGASATRFELAFKLYAETGDCLVMGCLVNGKRPADEKDLAAAEESLKKHVGQQDLWLLSFYLPFDKKDWPALVASEGGPT